MKYPPEYGENSFALLPILLYSVKGLISGG